MISDTVLTAIKALSIFSIEMVLLCVHSAAML